MQYLKNYFKFLNNRLRGNQQILASHLKIHRLTLKRANCNILEGAGAQRKYYCDMTLINIKGQRNVLNQKNAREFTTQHQRTLIPTIQTQKIILEVCITQEWEDLSRTIY